MLDNPEFKQETRGLTFTTEKNSRNETFNSPKTMFGSSVSTTIFFKMVSSFY